MNLYIFKDGRIVTGGDPLNIDLAGLVVCVTNPQEGQVLTYNGEMWVNAEPTGLVADVSEPEEGQVLTYDGDKWTNADLPT